MVGVIVIPVLLIMIIAIIIVIAITIMIIKNQFLASAGSVYSSQATATTGHGAGGLCSTHQTIDVCFFPFGGRRDILENVAPDARKTKYLLTFSPVKVMTASKPLTQGPKVNRGKSSLVPADGSPLAHGKSRDPPYYIFNTNHPTTTTLPQNTS